ncbi:MAG: glutamate--tRNA ligase [Candidatus Nanopelagicaceae bacterium]|nr:glutamate--tRNA ligase [Candidatus Nanopelagicaceae bacterium]
MANSSTREVRTRFAPSPTGDLHVGNIRTALFAWAYARHCSGKLIFRVEDTDRERVTDEYIARAIETLKWLGIDWDEGPEVGGEHGPYLQSQRLDTYKHWADIFIKNGDAYHCYCSTDELEKRRDKQRELNQAPGYDGKCRELTSGEIEAFISQGRAPVVRMRMPDGETTFNDLIRGEVSFEHKYVPDFVLMRADGSPLYTLAVAVDDVLMKITHVLRGEDLLSSTPRQIRVYQAMGVAVEDFPLFAHLPFVMGQDNAKLSKRNGEVSIAWYRESGFLPEAICNYLALLGWSPGDDREDISMSELVELFVLERVNSSPARFDMKKLEAINGEKIRNLTLDDFLSRALPFLLKDGVVSGKDEELTVLRQALPIIQERIARMNEVSAMLKFLFTDELSFDQEASAALSNEQAKAVIAKSLEVLQGVDDWSHGAIEAKLREALIDQMALKPRLAFSPVRIAVTGSHISPPLFESMELLGKQRCISRLNAAVS